jgi:hypothetical protein
MTTNAQRNVLVLKNEAGEYFVLPEELVEQGRVPAEHIGDVERVFDAAAANDLTGYLSLNFTKITYNTTFAGAFVGGGTALGPVTTPGRSDRSPLHPAGSGG